MPERTAPRTYRTVLRLYPRPFRSAYGADMEVFVADLIADRGPAAATARIVLDTLVTVPRYHLEAVMHPTRTPFITIIIAATLAVAGAALIAAGFMPALVVIVAGALIAVSQRTTLAKALHPESAVPARRRFVAAGVAAVVAAATLVVGLVDLGDEPTWPANRVLAYNLVFFAAVAAAITLAILAASTRRATAAR